MKETETLLSDVLRETKNKNSALGRCKELIIIGLDDNDNVYFNSNTSSAMHTLWMLDNAKKGMLL